MRQGLAHQGNDCRMGTRCGSPSDYVVEFTHGGEPLRRRVCHEHLERAVDLAIADSVGGPYGTGPDYMPGKGVTVRRFTARDEGPI